MERAEIAPPALRIGVAADDEFLAALAFDLDPIPRAPAHVPAPDLFRHDSFQSPVGGCVKECFTSFLDVVAVARPAQRWKELLQAFFALDQRKRTKIASFESKAIEENPFHGHHPRRALDVIIAGEMHARLKFLKTWLSVLVEGNDLAINDKMIHGQSFERLSQFWITVRHQRSVAPDHFNSVSVPLRKHPYAIILNLENPLGSRKGPLL